MLPNTTRQESDYSLVVRQGHYGNSPCGLAGKLDNVRRYWENQLTRLYLAPGLKRLVNRARSEGRGLRIVDLGCGAGEGWDLLTGIPHPDDEARPLLAPEDIETYLGLDLCPDMVQTARVRFSRQPRARFRQADLRQPHELSGPFDLYFSSYGSPSHLEDQELASLLRQLASTAPTGSLVVLDLLGQYSLEWPGLWGYSREPGRPRMQPYNMLWLYPEEERATRRQEFADYRIRYWGGGELRSFLAGLPMAPRIRHLDLFDRSIFVGRHLDTGEFSPTPLPIRRGVNGLFEFNHFTRARDLAVPPIPDRPGTVCAFLRSYRRLWNHLVEVFELLCQGAPEEEVLRCASGLDLPSRLADALETLIQHARSMDWRMAPIRNSLQPQFGFLLRQTEYSLQRGLGCGHGLLAILELS
ncbi:MAG: class I SAM-dependent methyltransferase [Candidatus Eremiobacterota bacterium]